MGLGDFPGLGGGESLPSGDPVVPPDLTQDFAADLLNRGLVSKEADALLHGWINKKSREVSEVLSRFVAAGQAGMAALAGDDPASSARGVPRMAAPAPPRLAEHLAGAPVIQVVSENAQGDSHVGARPGDPTSETQGSGPVKRQRIVPKRPNEPEPEPMQEPAEAEGPKSQPKIRDTFKESRDRGSKMTMGQIAKAVSAPVAKSISESMNNKPIQWRHSTDEFGVDSWYQVDRSSGEPVEVEGSRISSHLTNPNGTPVVDDYGDLVANPEYAEQESSLRRRQMGRNAVLGVVSGQLAKSGAIKAATAGAVRLAGPIGVAVGVADQTADWFEEQNAAAMPFRQITGEETSPLAVRERFANWRSGWSGWGTIGRDQAKQNDMMIRQMGLQGDDLDKGRQFLEDNAMSYGMDPQVAARMVEQTTRTSATLNDFERALAGVAAGAVAAGVSVTEAQKSMIETSEALIAQGVRGAQAVRIAEDLDQAALGLGKQGYQDIGGGAGIASGMTPENAMMLQTMGGGGGVGGLQAYLDMIDPSKTGTKSKEVSGQMEQFVVSQAALMLGASVEEWTAHVQQATQGAEPTDEMAFRALTSFRGPDWTVPLISQLGSIYAMAGFSELPKEGEQAQITMLIRFTQGRLYQGITKVNEATDTLFGGPTDYGSLAPWEAAALDAGSSSGRTTSGSSAPVRSGAGGGSPSTTPGNPLNILGSTQWTPSSAPSTGTPGEIRYQVVSPGRTGEEPSESRSGRGERGQRDTSIRVVLDMTPETKRHFQGDVGPSEDQRAARPPSGADAPYNYPAYGAP